MKIKVINCSKKINLPAEFLYNLIINVEKYPKFLNYVKSVKIDCVYKNNMIIKMLVGYGLIKFSYDCMVTMYPISEVQIFSNNGPFILLKANWKFIKLNNYTTIVKHKLEYKLHNRLLEKIAVSMLENNKNYTINAFENYAKNLFN